MVKVLKPGLIKRIKSSIARGLSEYLSMKPEDSSVIIVFEVVEIISCHKIGSYMLSEKVATPIHYFFLFYSHSYFVRADIVAAFRNFWFLCFTPTTNNASFSLQSPWSIMNRILLVYSNLFIVDFLQDTVEKLNYFS